MNGTPKLHTRSIQDVTVVSFDEARLLDASQIQTIGNELYRLVDALSCRKLILDMSQVQFLSSGAVGVLINLRNKLAALKGQLAICGVRPELLKVFELMKLQKVFTFCRDEREALEKLGHAAAG